MIDPMRVALKSVAVASAVAGLGAANAQAQTIIHVGGQNAIGDSTLTTTAGVATLPNSGGDWAAAGGEGVVYTHLTSPPLKVPSTGPVTLKFTHRYNFEQNWDGGAVYVTVNGIGPTHVEGTGFTAHGYDGLLVGPGEPPSWVSSVFVGTQAFTGQSAGYDTPALIESVVNLGTLNADDTISIEFRGGWDLSLIHI